MILNWISNIFLCKILNIRCYQLTISINYFFWTKVLLVLFTHILARQEWWHTSCCSIYRFVSVSFHNSGMSDGLLTANYIAFRLKILRVNHPICEAPAYSVWLTFQFVPINTQSISRNFIPPVFYLIFALSTRNQTSF